MTIKTDFDSGPYNDFGVVVTRVPVTIDTGSTGQKTYNQTASEEITVVFMSPKKKYGLDKAGLTEVCDAKMFTKSDQTINKYDQIIFSGRAYFVDKVRRRKFNGLLGFKSVLLFFV